MVSPAVGGDLLERRRAGVSYVGALVRKGLADGREVRIGGVGGIKTHPQVRRQGLAALAIRRTIEHFQELEVDFALLVCEPELVPFYERLGWKLHSGELFVTQRGESMKFTFNLPLTYPVRTIAPPDGVIDLSGPPW